MAMSGHDCLLLYRMRAAAHGPADSVPWHPPVSASTSASATATPYVDMVIIMFRGGALRSAFTPPSSTACNMTLPLKPAMGHVLAMSCCQVKASPSLAAAGLRRSTRV